MGTIAGLVKQIRLENKQTQRSLSNNLRGIEYDWLTKLESGNIKNPSFTKILKILDFGGWGINSAMEYLYGHKFRTYASQDNTPSEYCKYCGKSKEDILFPKR